MQKSNYGSLAPANRLDTSRLEQIQRQGYERAAQYYTTRRRMIMNNLAQQYIKQYGPLSNDQLDKISEILLNEVYNKAAKDFQSAVEKMIEEGLIKSYNGLLSGGSIKIRTTGGSQYFSITDSDMKKIAKTFGVTTGDIYSAKIQAEGGSKVSFATLLGYLYERFIVPKYKELSEKLNSSLENDLPEELLAEVISNLNASNTNLKVTGSLKTTRKGATRLKGKESSVDVGYNMINKSGNLNSLAEAKVNAFINIESFDEQGKKFEKSQIKQEQILSAYFQELNTYGFQIKKYSTEKQYRLLPIRTSANTRKQLNSIFERGQYGWEQNHTWAGKYAYYYMTSFLSSNLIPLLGPALLGFSFGNKFIYMDDFINSYTFVHMLKQRMNDTDINSSSKQEILPIINSNTLYAAQKSMSMDKILTINEQKKNFISYKLETNSK